MGIDDLKLRVDRYRLGIPDRPLIPDMIENNSRNQHWQQKEVEGVGRNMSYRCIIFPMVFVRQTCPQCGNEFINRVPPFSEGKVCTNCYWVNFDYSYIDGDEDDYDYWEDPDCLSFNPDYILGDCDD